MATRITYKTTFQGNTWIGEEEIEDDCWKCPICGDYFDEFGNLVYYPTEYLPMDGLCDNCKAADAFETLTPVDCEGYLNLYVFYKNGDPKHMGRFWMWFASRLNIELNIAKGVMILLFDLNSEMKYVDYTPGRTEF